MIRHIYYIRRDDKPLLFVNLDNLKKGEGSVDKFVYKLSSSISREEERIARDAVLSSIERDLSLYIQDKSYIKRLLLTALLFIISYFFLSFVVRDPIPMIDELIISSVVALFVWMMAKKHDYESVLVGSDRENYRRALEEAEFEYTSEVQNVEEYIAMLKGLDLKALSVLIASNDLPALDELSDELVSAIEYSVLHSNKLIARYSREILTSAKNPLSISKSIIKDSATGNLDPILLALYIKISQNAK